MNKLSSSEKKVLEQLLIEGGDDDGSIDAKRFRADNYADLAVIESLVKGRYIIESGGRYKISVLSLELIDSAGARGLMIKAEKLWRAYREHYRKHLDATVMLAAIAEQSGISVTAANQVLKYMLELPWSSGYSTSADRLYQAVGASETVLKYETFSAYLDEVRSWGKPPGTVSNSPLESLLNGRVETKADIKKLPSWFTKIPEQAQQLLKEVYVAQDHSLLTLAAMGVRGVVDVICSDVLKGDYGSFDAKLKRLLDDGYLTGAQHKVLTAVVELGHAASHRAHTPDAESLQTMIGSLHHMLESIYALEHSTQSLKSKTPERRSKPSPK